MTDSSDWLRHLDSKIDTMTQIIKEDIHRLSSKLDSKADRAELEKLQSKTQHLEVKHAGISAVVASLILGIKALLGVGN